MRRRLRAGGGRRRASSRAATPTTVIDPQSGDPRAAGRSRTKPSRCAVAAGPGSDRSPGEPDAGAFRARTKRRQPAPRSSRPPAATAPTVPWCWIHTNAVVRHPLARVSTSAGIVVVSPAARPPSSDGAATPYRPASASARRCDGGTVAEPVDCERVREQHVLGDASTPRRGIPPAGPWRQPRSWSGRPDGVVGDEEVDDEVRGHADGLVQARRTGRAVGVDVEQDASPPGIAIGRERVGEQSLGHTSAPRLPQYAEAADVPVVVVGVPLASRCTPRPACRRSRPLASVRGPPRLGSVDRPTTRRSVRSWWLKWSRKAVSRTWWTTRRSSSVLPAARMVTPGGGDANTSSRSSGRASRKNVRSSSNPSAASSSVRWECLPVGAGLESDGGRTRRPDARLGIGEEGVARSSPRRCGRPRAGAPDRRTSRRRSLRRPRPPTTPSRRPGRAEAGSVTSQWWVAAGLRGLSSCSRTSSVLQSLKPRTGSSQARVSRQMASMSSRVGRRTAKSSGGCTGRGCQRWPTAGNGFALARAGAWDSARPGCRFRVRCPFGRWYEPAGSHRRPSSSTGRIDN